MDTWKQDPAILWRLLEAEAKVNRALRRRLAIYDVLARRGSTRWETLVAEVEQQAGAGIFGPAPQSRLWADLRALRDAGVEIGYSRQRGHEGYFLHASALGQEVVEVLERVRRDLDPEHMRHMAPVSGTQRIEAMLEMIELMPEISAAGRAAREREAESEE